MESKFGEGKKTYSLGRLYAKCQDTSDNKRVYEYGRIEKRAKVVQLNYMKKVINVIKKILYKNSKKDLSTYYYSLIKSHEEICCNVDISLEHEYISRTKLCEFLEEMGIKRKVYNERQKSIEGSLLQESSPVSLKSQIIEKTLFESDPLRSALQENCKKIKKRLKPYTEVNEGQYTALHFPVMNGSMELSLYRAKYKDLYWWCGRYRDLELYLCGRRSNLNDRIKKCTFDVWNPSGRDSSVAFFNDIYTYITKQRTNNIIKEKNSNDFFQTLAEHLHSGTARCASNHTRFGWKNMIIRCDKISRTDGNIMIFGSPVVVSSNTDNGYGWYEIEEVDDLGFKWCEHFYEYDNGRFTGKVLKTENFSSNMFRDMTVNKDILLDVNGGFFWRDFKRRAIYCREYYSLNIKEVENKNWLKQEMVKNENILGLSLSTRVLNEIKKRR